MKEIDSNTYNVTPSTLFDGDGWQENWSGYRARFPDYDINSQFIITP